MTQTTATENGYTTITTTYDYDGLQFCVEASVDAVQEHNAFPLAMSNSSLFTHIYTGFIVSYNFQNLKYEFIIMSPVLLLK